MLWVIHLILNELTLVDLNRASKLLNLL